MSQIRRGRSPGHWLHALRPDRRAGRHAEIREGHRLDVALKVKQRGVAETN